jgi:hypothetical protein
MEPDMLGGIGACNSQRPVEAVLESLLQLGQPISEVLSRDFVMPEIGFSEIVELDITRRLPDASNLIWVLHSYQSARHGLASWAKRHG